jgi:hypothetical protein
MKTARAIKQRWLEESGLQPSNGDFAGFCPSEGTTTGLIDHKQSAGVSPSIATGGRDWIVQERSVSPFMDKERVAQSATLDSFRNLRQGWDSYHAEPPSAKAIENARHVLHVLWSSEAALPVRQISPSVEGGVAIVFTGRGQRYADIECFNNGDILAITSDGTTEPSVWSLNEGGSIRRAVEKLNAFFNE